MLWGLPLAYLLKRLLLPLFCYGYLFSCLSFLMVILVMVVVMRLVLPYPIGV